MLKPLMLKFYSDLFVRLMDIVDKQIPAKLKPIGTPGSFVEKWWQTVDDPRHHFFTAKLPRVSLPAL